MITRVICSFKAGSRSAAGLDRLSPQHLKELTSHLVGEACSQLLESLAMMLLGKIPAVFLPFGANLVALRKPDGRR